MDIIFYWISFKEIPPIYYVATQKNMHVFNSHVICSNNLNTRLKETILKLNLIESFVQNNDLCSVRTSFDLDPTQEWIQTHVAQTMNL